MYKNGAMKGQSYNEGYQCGLNSDPWTWVPYKPGTYDFHGWLEGHADGLKARHLIKHSHGHSH